MAATGISYLHLLTHSCFVKEIIMSERNPFLEAGNQRSLSRNGLKAIFSEIFNNDCRKTNLAMAAFDSGIAQTIKSSDCINRDIKDKCVNILVEDFCIREQDAEWCVIYWLTKYGIEYLRKPHTDDLLKNDLSGIANKVSQIVECGQTNTVTETEICIPIANLKEGEILPSSIICHDPEEEQRKGITKLICTCIADQVL